MFAHLMGAHWFELLVISPIAGVIWSLLITKWVEKRRKKKLVDGHQADSQRAVVKGSNNQVKQVSGSYNRKEIHNHYHGNRPNSNDDVGVGIAVLFGAFIVASGLSWLFAKYGEIAIPAVLILSSVVSSAITTFVITGFLNRGYYEKDIPLAIILLTIVVANICSLLLLKGHVDPRVIEYANSETNVLSFFVGLTAYGKSLLLTQALCLILVGVSQILLVLRVVKMDGGSSRWGLDMALFLPVFGLFPLWLSNPEWAALFIMKQAV